MAFADSYPTILGALEARAVDSRDRVAFVAAGQVLSFGALREESIWLAPRLSRAGLRRGERCLIILPSGLDFVRLVYAVQLTGAIPVAADPALAPAARARRVAVADPVVVVTTPEVAASLAGRAGRATVLTLDGVRALGASPVPLAPAPDPSDTAYLQFTSGSTGEPRACVIDHAALASALVALQDRYDLSARDVLANWLPLHYSAGLVRHVFGSVAFGCPSHLVAPSAAAMPAWLQVISTARATVTISPDSGFRLGARLVDPAAVDLRCLRVAACGGELVRADTVRGFEGRFGLSRVVQPAFGLSEGTLTIAANAAGSPLVVDQRGCVSCGTALAGVELRVVDAGGRECPRGEVGELQFRGGTLFRGYFNDEAGTRALMAADGWCQPGDRAVLDEAGRLFVRGRTRAMIKRGGATIAPREVEDPVSLLDGVSGCAAIGVSRDGSTTEDLVVVVEVDEPPDHPEVLASAARRASVDAVRVQPAAVFVVRQGAIPRSASGKTRYADLRTRIEGDGFGSDLIVDG